MLVVGHRSWPGRTGQSSNKYHVAGMMGGIFQRNWLFGWQTVTFQIYWFSIQRMIAYIVYIYMCVQYTIRGSPEQSFEMRISTSLYILKTEMLAPKDRNISKNIPNYSEIMFQFPWFVFRHCQVFRESRSNEECIYVITLCRWIFVGPGMMPLSHKECWHNFGPKCPAWRQGGGPAGRHLHGCFLEWGTQMDR